MAKAGAKIQAPLGKLLFDGQVSFVEDLNSLQFSAKQPNVKMEEGWYDFVAMVGSASRSEASNEPTSSNSAAPSGTSSNCVVIETLSTLAKTKAPNLIMLDPAIASPTH